MSARQAYFTSATFVFLRDLSRNNRKDWFDPRKNRYEAEVRGPALRFIEAAAPGLAKISSQVIADPRPLGGSLMRVYRDVRFARDKSPYKTNVGIGFGHRRGRDGAAPGYYLHLTAEPGADNFSGGGIHMADTATLNRVRDAIVDDTASWKRATGGAKFRASQELGGDALKNPPKGYPADHPMVEDLKRKGFFAHAKYTQAQVCDPGFLDLFLENCRTEAPMMAFLAAAVGADW
ncbi:MAG: hypothetical protein QOE92_1998 [Chloroflexota bacterium]|jgi:uncharacterized protein (TIGR02453 family)|nr:hypothetical protein [Chloroflexota bacterium]